MTRLPSEKESEEEEEEDDVEWVLLDESSVNDSGTCSSSGSSLGDSLDIDIGDLSPTHCEDAPLRVGFLELGCGREADKPYQASRPHPSSRNPVVYERIRCLNRFVGHSVNSSVCYCVCHNNKLNFTPCRSIFSTATHIERLLPIWHLWYCRCL